MKRSKKIFATLAVSLTLLFAGTEVFALTAGISVVNDIGSTPTHGNAYTTDANYGINNSSSYLRVSASGFYNSTYGLPVYLGGTTYRSSIINGKLSTTNYWYTQIWDPHYNYSSYSTTSY